jgi:Ca-activated chloride channel family protein
MRFADPLFLLLLAAIPVYLWWEKVRGGQKRPTFLYSSLRLFEGVGRGEKARFEKVPHIFKIVSLVLIVIALARPQGGKGVEEISAKGIDIMIVLDISGSMKSEDFTPKNRLHVAKEVISEFIDNRQNDRLGLVVFAGGAITQCPLTTDHAALKRLLQGARIGLIEDGTAIGVAIATGTNRLKDARGESRVLVLTTDGVNNRGEIDPVTAAELAASFGVKIYTIGVGTQGTAPYPIEDPVFGKRYVQVEVEIDEKVLKEIASITGARYYRATNPDALRKIYEEIDSMEKTVVSTKTHTVYTEFYPMFVAPAAFLLSLSGILSGTYLRRLP